MKPHELHKQDRGVASMTPAKITAIRAAEKLATLIEENYPEIVDDYRMGLSQPEIVQKYSLDVGYNLAIARNAVREALKKLMNPDEMQELGAKRMAENGKRTGSNSVENKLGMYNITPEAHRLRSIHAGKAAHRAKVGIFALSPAERQESARHASSHRTIEERQKVIREALLKVGKVPWYDELVDPVFQLNEVDYLLRLSRNPEYIIQGGARKGCTNNSKIAAKLNEIFHEGSEVRTASAISSKLSRTNK